VAKRAPITEDQLHHWKLLDRFRQEVLPLLAARSLTSTERDQRRTLFAEDYFCAFLFAMLNPVVTSLRALCHASHCVKMRQVCSAPISPVAFSAAQHQFAPEVLDQVVRSLAQQALGQGQGGDPRTRQALAALTAVDGTLLRAVPRMAWTPAAGPTWAVRLHLHFSVFDQVPEAWTITPGSVCERKVFNQTVQPGAMVVADRYFSNHHAGGFVGRVDQPHLPAALADRTVFQVDQNDSQLPPLAGRIARRGANPDLLCAHRLLAVDVVDRPAPQQAHGRIAAMVLDGHGQRGRPGDAVGASRLQEKILNWLTGG